MRRRVMAAEKYGSFLFILGLVFGIAASPAAADLFRLPRPEAESHFVPLRAMHYAVPYGHYATSWRPFVPASLPQVCDPGIRQPMPQPGTRLGETVQPEQSQRLPA